jgi:hypothetical protein
MTDRKDFVLDENFDIVFENGEIKTTQSDLQHCRLILATYRGDWSQFKNLGAGLIQILQGTLDGRFRREAQLQLQSDGYKMKSISFDNNSGKLNLTLE